MDENPNANASTVQLTKRPVTPKDDKRERIALLHGSGNRGDFLKLLWESYKKLEMAMIDMTHRKLRFPPRFVPYLERHRIFELFHECVELLVDAKPKDHIQFLKNVLPCAAMKKDKQRIVFISPTSFDRETFSELLAECLGISNISLMNLETLTRNKKMEEVVKIEAISESETSEEESCICPEEGGVSPIRPLYYPPGSETGFYEPQIEFEASILGEERQFELDDTDEEGAGGSRQGLEVPGEEEEGEGGKTIECIKEEEGEGKEPCICVCPCKKKLQTEKTEEKEEEKEEMEEIQTLEKKKKKKKKTGWKGKNGEEEEEVEEEEEGEYVGEGEEQETWDYLPCPPHKPKEKKKRGAQADDRPFWISPIISGSIIEIDFGILKECDIVSKGWILQDFPLTDTEVEKLNALGVIPTHALRIILDETEEEKSQEYKMLLKGWMKAYQYVPIMEIRVNGRNLNQLVKDMCSLLSLMPHRHAPMLPRIVLIGPRGSGVTTQAQKLAMKYGMVHVEFDVVMSRALQEDDELCKLYKVQLATRPDPELEAVILERALLSIPCRNRGWVLTGYPTHVDQMRMLDIMATPPNRVIFIEVPARECFVRLYYRKIDPCLGDEYKLPVIEPSGADSFVTTGLDPAVAERLLSHPKNNKKQIIRDIEEYFLKKNDLMMYCGKTASYVDGDKEVDRVFELIEQAVVNPAPPQPPRDPLSVHRGIEESYERLKKFRLARGMFFNNLLLNPPENKRH